MDHLQPDPALNIHLPGHQEAWEMVLGSLRGVMLQWLLDDAIDLGAVRDRLLAMVDLTLARGV